MLITYSLQKYCTTGWRDQPLNQADRIKVDPAQSARFLCNVSVCYVSLNQYTGLSSITPGLSWKRTY